MKKLFLLAGISLLSVAAFYSCDTSGSKSEGGDSSLQEAADTIEQIVEEATATNIPFVAQKFEKQVGENKLEIEFPTQGNEALLDSVRVWMNSQLGATYRGDIADGSKFFNHYASQLGKDPDLEEYGGYSQDEFEVEYKNDNIVTYEHSTYIFEGGAHGIGGDYGTTFLQADGSMFSRDCITSYTELQGLFVEGLKEYFNVKTDKELIQNLVEVANTSDIPAPAIEPWITEKGVAFSYAPYEIAPYSAGMPNFTIPYAKIEPYLTPKGKRFFGK